MADAPSLLDLRVDRPVHGGRCVAYPIDPTADAANAPQGTGAAPPSSGRGPERRQVVLVAGAIPGERVRARVETRKGVAFGEVVEVLEADADRVAAPEHPGLDLGHVGYLRQLAWKRAVLEDALRRAGLAVPEGAEAGGLDVVASPEVWGYRNAIQPAVASTAQGVAEAAVDATRLGYRRPGGHDVVALPDDPTANEACRAAWTALEGERLPRGVVEVAIRGNDAGEALATLIATG
jgi:tRNA/tmRNA/rRNA uracil-C5-methylase (TrmA/RlmC/RlmD family)